MNTLTLGAPQFSPRFGDFKLPGWKQLAIAVLWAAYEIAGGWKAELRTNAGTDHQARVTFDTASNGTGSYAAANFIGLTENATAPAAGDTTLAAELTTGGFTRVQAVYAHTNGTNTVTLTRTFNATETRTINKAGLFTAVSAGTMSFSTLVPNPPTLVSGDSVAITWTFTI